MWSEMVVDPQGNKVERFKKISLPIDPDLPKPRIEVKMRRLPKNTFGLAIFQFN